MPKLKKIQSDILSNFGDFEGQILEIGWAENPREEQRRPFFLD